MARPDTRGWRFWRAWYPTLGVLAVLGVAVGYGLWEDHEALRPSGEFHQMTAQIVPVLLVAVAVEQSARWGHRHSRFTRPVILALLVGEITALLAVAFGATEDRVFLVDGSESNTDVLSSLSVAALAIGFLGVVVIALARGSDTGPYRARGSSSGG